MLEISRRHGAGAGGGAEALSHRGLLLAIALPVARTEKLNDTDDDSLELTALSRNADREFQEIIKLSPTLAEQVKIAALNTEEPGKLADLIGANLNLSLEERQHLLETPSAKDRLTRLLPLLSRELEVLKLGSKIQNEVVASMSKNQRDFFLREQIRAIQRELGETNRGGRGQGTAGANRAEPTAGGAEEGGAQGAGAIAADAAGGGRVHDDAQLPGLADQSAVTEFTEDKLDLAAAARLLEEQHFGLRKVKDRLLEFLAVIKLKQQLKGPILCLVGPPGVGKTSLGKSVAEPLGRKFARISLGGMRDEAEIRGHRRTYVGALPGRIIQACAGSNRTTRSSSWMSWTKSARIFAAIPPPRCSKCWIPPQNNAFVDHYLDVP